MAKEEMKLVANNKKAYHDYFIEEKYEAAHAAYRDEEGELHIFSKRCAHMGCELTWNPDEQSWDCPCHGSRFDADGRLLDNPSKSGMKKQADGKTE